ncbi:MAG: anti-sigma factor family protein [Actinomycetota bacterium]
MNCTTVRDRLAEHALGALTQRDAQPVDRHLAWCAACRKEAGELQQASATLAFTLAPDDPPAELADRVVAGIRDAVERRDRRPSSSPRRSRLTLVAALAAMLAVLGTGWGAVMAGRAARSDRLVRLETIRSQSAVERFRDLLNSAEFGDPQDEVFLGTLSPASAGGGGGSALTLVSPSIIDMAIVLVNGVPEETRELLPFTVRLRGDDGVLMVGRIEKGALDDSGAGIVMREFDELIGYDSVIVRDVNGDVVLSGSMQTRAAVTSPSP